MKLTVNKRKEMHDYYLNHPNSNCETVGKLFGLQRCSVYESLTKAGIKVRNDKDRLRREYQVNENFFSIIDTEQKAYILGFLYADGCNIRRGINIGIHSQDVDILEKIKTCMGSEHRFYPSKTTKMLQFVLYSRKLSNDLSKLGCVPKKTFKLKFPKENQVSTLYTKDFIRGYFDGDGCVYFKLINNNLKVSCSITSTKSFCRSIQKFIKKELNIHVWLGKDHNVYRIQITGIANCIKFLQWIYKDSDIHLNRKYSKYTELKNIIVHYKNRKFGDLLK